MYASPTTTRRPLRTAQYAYQKWQAYRTICDRTRYERKITDERMGWRPEESSRRDGQRKLGIRHTSSLADE